MDSRNSFGGCRGFRYPSVLNAMLDFSCPLGTGNYSGQGSKERPNMRIWIFTSLTLAVLAAGCSTSQPQKTSEPAPVAQAEKPAAAPEAAKPQSGSEWEE